jgi:hypothetical protein
MQNHLTMVIQNGSGSLGIELLRLSLARIQRERRLDCAHLGLADRDGAVEHVAKVVCHQSGRLTGGFC